MKILTCSFILIFLCLAVSAQTNDTWIAFWNKDTTLVGYKDKNGTVKIEPKFQSGAVAANRFDNIIGVVEEVDKHWKFYYLTKSGKIVGRDSVHMFDNGIDCESEGFIRFRDKKTDKVGLFNRNGKIVISAEYNELSSVHNGMIIALVGAKKKYWEGGEHYSWIGGKEILIDTTNNMLIDSFKYAGNLNFFSLLVSAQPNDSTNRQNFKAIDGRFFSFEDFDKEFETWLKKSLLDNFTKNSLLDATYKTITFWREDEGWGSEDKNSFINRNFELIKAKLLQLNSTDCSYNIFHERLNRFIYESDEYQEFFSNCGEAKDWIYPVKNIVISYKEDKDGVQDHIEFLRTGNGYKLISLSIRKGEIK